MGDLLTDRGEIHVVGAAIVRDEPDGHSCLVARRAQSMPEAGLWEFPGGKVERGESPEQALEREIAEELGCRIEVGEQLGTGRATSMGRRVRLDVYAARVTVGEPSPREHAELLWTAPDRLSGLDWAPADVPVVPEVARWLRRRSSARQP